MKSFKKRTIALVLASVVSIAGSFAAERYKNSIMSLKFEASDNGAINLFVETEKPYGNTLTLSKRDANTYVMMLPEMNSKAATPILTQNPSIASVSVNTLPYTTTAKGYTRIVVKTKTPIYLQAQPRLYIPSEEDFRRIQEAKEEAQRRQEQLLMEEQERTNIEVRRRMEAAREAETLRRDRQENSSTVQQKKTPVKQIEEKRYEEDVESSVENNVDIPVQTNSYQQDSSEKYLLVLAILLLLFISAFFFVRARNKMADVAGGKFEIDTDNEENGLSKSKEIENKKNQVEKPIKSQEARISKITDKDILTLPSQAIVAVSEENSDIVDLDELFHEKALGADSEENAALEEFLNGFSYDEEYAQKEIEEAHKFNEAFYNSVMNSKCLEFTPDDIDRLNKLLKSEILDDTIKNISNYLVSNPIKPAISPEKILENFVTTLSVSNNITFTKEDMDALYKIITVEFDRDFVTDLRVDPNRTKQMEEELKIYHKEVRKPSKVKTLNVKKDLPNLSKVASKPSQKVNSDYKTKAMDYSKNCQVETLEVDLDVDFSVKQEKKEKDKIELVENNWETETLKISDMLPDLDDAMQNPDKYKKPEPEKFVANEDSLLAGLSNITFKPFDDNSKSFEIINDVEELNNLEEPVIELRSSSDVQEELKRWYELEHLGVPEEPKITFESTKVVEQSEEKNNSFVQQEQTLSQKPVKKVFEPEKSVVKPLPQIRQQQPRPVQVQKQETSQQKVNTETKCVWENQAFNVASTVNFNDGNIGCHLAKNDSGYVILGFINDKLFKIKEYQELKSEKIQARLSEKLPNGNARYLVRIGINKIIVEVSDTEIKYVLDLC